MSRTPANKASETTTTTGVEAAAEETSQKVMSIALEKDNSYTIVVNDGKKDTKLKTTSEEGVKLHVGKMVTLKTVEGQLTIDTTVVEGGKVRRNSPYGITFPALSH